MEFLGKVLITEATGKCRRGHGLGWRRERLRRTKQKQRFLIKPMLTKSLYLQKCHCAYYRSIKCLLPILNRKYLLYYKTTINWGNLIQFTQVLYRKVSHIHLYDMLLKYWQSKFLFLGLRGWTKHMFLRKSSSSQGQVWKYQLAKVGAEDGLSYIASLSTANTWLS